MAKVHLISDESLGGIQREYVEVDRKADVGDYVIVHGEDIEKVIGHIDLHISGIELAEYWVGEGEYRTLAPTDIVQIDGVRYRMVERKAAVGERVIIVEEDDLNGDCYDNGHIFVIDKPDVNFEDLSITDGNVTLFDREYRVLVPVESEPITVDTTQASPQVSVEVDESQASPAVVNMLANLAQRIVALESELAELKSRESVNTLARDLAEFIAKEARNHGRRD